MAFSEREDALGQHDHKSPSTNGDDGMARGAAWVFENAKSATDKERKMTLLQGIRLYPKAVAWSLLISTCSKAVSALLILPKIKANSE
jgi:SP family general alpha glucoside:H+ symporter-like MFS transporter